MRFLLLLATMLFTAHALPVLANPTVSLTKRNEDDSAPAPIEEAPAPDHSTEDHSQDHVDLAVRSEHEPEETGAAESSESPDQESVDVARRYEDDSEDDSAPESHNDDE